MYTDVCIHTCMYTDVCMYIHKCIVLPCWSARNHTHNHTYAHTHTCIYTHTTHQHTLYTYTTHHTHMYTTHPHTTHTHIMHTHMHTHSNTPTNTRHQVSNHLFRHPMCGGPDTKFTPCVWGGPHSPTKWGRSSQLCLEGEKVGSKESKDTTTLMITPAVVYLKFMATSVDG